MNISFDKQNLPTTLSLIVAILILLGSLAVAIWPREDVNKTIQTMKAKSFKSQLNGWEARKKAELEHAAAIQQTWPGGGVDLGPVAYSNLHKLAAARNVTIVGVRPQRVIDAGDITQVPFVVNVQGAYISVLSFVRDIETTPSKLAVELLQLGSADESSDQVTGTIGVEAYVLNSTTTTATTTTTTRKATRAKLSPNPGATISGTKQQSAGATHAH